MQEKLDIAFWTLQLMSALLTVQEAQASGLPLLSTTTPAIIQAPTRCDADRAEFEKYAWPVHEALQVCDAESHGNPNAVGDTDTAYVSCGLMQVRTLPGRPSCTELKD